MYCIALTYDIQSIPTDWADWAQFLLQFQFNCNRAELDNEVSGNYPAGLHHTDTGWDHQPFIIKYL